MLRDLHIVRCGHDQLHPTTLGRIAANRFVERQHVDRMDDASLGFEAPIYAIEPAQQAGEILLDAAGEALATSVAIRASLDPALLGAVRRRLHELPGDWHEIFPSDHNVNRGFHFPDPWGEASALLDELESALDVTRPPVNHNKVSSKKEPRYRLDELHIDSFEGMRTDDNGRRRRVWRYFLNLGNKPRRTALVPLNPRLVDDLVPINHQPEMFDDLLMAAGGILPVALITIPPLRDDLISGAKICTTHMLHGEYGPADDLLAIVNSLA